MAFDDLLIEQAFEKHQKGDLNEAAEICRGLLKENSNDVEALHLLGVILSGAGLNDQAVGMLEQALAIGGPNSSMLHNYGVALQGVGALKKAAQAFRHAAEAAPLRTDSWYGLGEVELQREELPNALRAFEKVLEQDPDSIEARNNLGIILRKLGRLKEARTHLQKIVNADPKDAAAQNNLGITETELDNLSAAKIAFQSALGVAPHYADAHYNLGNVHLANLDFQLAAEYYLQTLELEPGNKPALYHLALCRQKQRAYDEALNLMNSLVESSDVENTQERILALGGRANILRDLGQFDAALKDIETALAVAPTDFALMGNKALTLQHAGCLDEAIAVYRDAVSVYPDNELVQSNLAQALLLAGQFKNGWREFEARLNEPKIAAKRNTMPGAAWQGESLADKHILLWCEQGLGDTLQFIRYVPNLVRNAARVSLICPDRLKRLLQSFAGDFTLIGDSEALPDADFNASLMSLPHLIGQDEIPNLGPYLAAEPDLISAWGEKMGLRVRPRIGLSWQGNPNYEADHQRSMPLRFMEPLITQLDYDFISLQQGFGEEQLMNISGTIEKFEEVDRTAAFIDSAAIMVNLDLVITSDTAVPHLAGALGVPVWLLLPKTPDWRWLLETPDSPWYSNMRLFRQTAAGDWQSVIDQVVDALDQDGIF
jgi:tetratricopeptide (TPR) repeat protein